jgi:hypothetical protein
MRSVRCDACGQKALIAASQCPHCGHLFALRDGSGELLPMAHCATCDSHYPLSQGACKWCGTAPEGVRIAPYAWKGAGALAFVALAWGAWWSSRPTDEIPATWKQPVAETAAVISLPQVVDAADTVSHDTGLVSSSQEPLLAVDTARGEAMTRSDAPLEPVAESWRGMREQHTQLIDTAPPAVPVASSSAPSVGMGAPVGAASAPIASRVTPPAPRQVVRATPPATKATARRAARWVSVVARTWIPVRANASGSSRIVASIGPDTRVQLGESRGGWRRLRTRGVSGWVEQRHFASR